MRAIGNNLILRPVFKDESSSKLILNVQKKAICWEVVSVGSNIITIDEGDHVLVHEYSMNEIEVDGEILYVVDYERVFAKK